MNSDCSAGKSHEPDRGFAKPHREDASNVEKRAAGERRHRSDLLDDALKDTFPGSDPVSITQPTGEESQ
jgi:hypothetical protein